MVTYEACAVQSGPAQIPTMAEVVPRVSQTAITFEIIFLAEFRVPLIEQPQAKLKTRETDVSGAFSQSRMSFIVGSINVKVPAPHPV